MKVGKKLPEAMYVHDTAFTEMPKQLSKLILAISSALKIEKDTWNVVKLSRTAFSLSLLSYPSFVKESYPALSRSVTVDLSKLTHKITDYTNYDNPPILHRKETMVIGSHPNYEDFRLITQEGEAAGLYDNPRHIGFKASWNTIINAHGYELVDGRLFRNSALINLSKQDKKINREKTAIVRYELSAPMKALAKYGFLDGQYSIFDYGCGRGDDLRELEAHGLDALGWDPNFLPDANKVNAELVNIGFVVNVIEERNERVESLQGAWELTEKLLVVSAMLANEKYLEQFTPYKDGIITSRNTFQKYFNQSELKLFVELSLNDQAIAVSPGIFFVFKDKNLEQEFLQSRHRRKHSWSHKSKPLVSKKMGTQLLISKHLGLFESFWQTCLMLGRCPVIDELENSQTLLEISGTTKKAFRLAKEYFDLKELEIAESMRREDLLVYFAVGLFGKRKAYKHQTSGTKRDIKAFFNTNANAQACASEILFQIADVEEIEIECLKAHGYLPASSLDSECGAPHSLTFHKKYMDLLSPLLRVYVCSALQLYGELDDIQLIKIHITSGKLTLLGFENFENSDRPRLKERVKIKMAEQDVDFFDYIEQREGLPILENKKQFIA